MYKSLDGDRRSFAADRGSALRRAVAAALDSASRVLARVAERLGPARTIVHAEEPPCEIEFRAEAEDLGGDLGGSIFRDGEWIGHLRGVKRL